MSGSRLYPPGLMKREIERLQEKTRSHFRLPPGECKIHVVGTPTHVLGQNVFSAIVDEGNFPKSTISPPYPIRVNGPWSGPWTTRPPRWVEFDVGTVVRHKESGHLAQVIDYATFSWGPSSYKLLWLTVDWRISHWSGDGFTKACPLEAVAAQAL